MEGPRRHQRSTVLWLYSVNTTLSLPFAGAKWEELNPAQFPWASQRTPCYHDKFTTGVSGSLGEKQVGQWVVHTYSLAHTRMHTHTCKISLYNYHGNWDKWPAQTKYFSTWKELTEGQWTALSWRWFIHLCCCVSLIICLNYSWCVLPITSPAPSKAKE